MRPEAALAGLLLAALAAVPASAQTVLQGQVGRAAVVLELDAPTPDGRVDGRYFYTRYRQSIPLEGERTPKGLVLRAQGFDEDAQERMSLQPDGRGWRGQFVKPGRPPLAGVLQPVPGQALPSLPAALRQENAQDYGPYERLQLAGLRFLPAGEQALPGGYRIRWLREPLSGRRMYEVVAGYPAPALAAINRQLHADFLALLARQFGCYDGQGGSGMDTADVHSVYLDARHVSHAIQYSWSCWGAAHPDFALEGTTLDARDGHRLELEDLWQPAPSAAPPRGSDGWFAWRRDVFAPAVVALLERLYPQELQADAGEDGCDYRDPEVWTFPAWYLSARGLYLGASFARVDRRCDNPDWSFVPTARLRDPAAPGRPQAGASRATTP